MKKVALRVSAGTDVMPDAPISRRSRGGLRLWLGVLTALTLSAQPLPNTAPLTLQSDLSAQMIAGIDRFLENETARVVQERAAFWKVDLSGDRDAYEKSIQPNRDRLARMFGVVDTRTKDIDVEYIATASTPAKVAETDRFIAYAVRWPVLEGLHGEGLLLQPKSRVIARVIALPDADQTPETIAGLAPGLAPELQYARRLAENGCEVLVPTLLDRTDTFSGSEVAGLHTNHPHREWIFRQSFVLGRHPIGYELQKIFAAIDWFARQNGGLRPADLVHGNRGTSASSGGDPTFGGTTSASSVARAEAGPPGMPPARDAPVPIGVAGWGEGGLLAFYSAALDRRIDVALVSGYFGRREKLWQEPIYRNAFGLLREFGDAEIARLIAPRALLVEHASPPKIDGPPAPRPRRGGAAPGQILPLAFADVRAEFDRARQLAGPHASALRLQHGRDGSTIGPVAESTLLPFLQFLFGQVKSVRPAGAAPRDLRANFDAAARQQRQVREIEGFTQRQLRLAERERDEFLWKKVTPTAPEAWREAMRPYREKVWHEMIGRFPTGQVPLNPRTRLLREWPTVTAYEVVLDVLPDVYAWGYLLLPKGMKPGDRRPVVVTQHGVNRTPDAVITEDPNAGYNGYKAFAVRLAERGFITFAPHNPYRDSHAARVLQRKAQPIGRTTFSIILAQHECILDFLSSLPNVDPARIGFYGLSYGGQSAMRMPPILERYALSICSGDFNEWTWKNASTDFPKSYMYNQAYERPEFRMGLTFGYAEMAALMVPRPFMVERGHNDTVGIDEWVAYEYAKVNRLYNKLGLGDRTEIEYFEGPHTIHGVGTFKFLHRHLNWPEPSEVRTSRSEAPRN